MSYTPINTKISIIGGGNIGTQFACKCASKGYCVNIFSSKPKLFSGTLEIIDENGKVTTGRINKASDSIESVLDGCRLVFVTHPAFRLKEVADQILPYVNTEMIICVLPGTGGAEYAFNLAVFNK